MSNEAIELIAILERLIGRYAGFADILNVSAAAVRGKVGLGQDPASQIRKALAEGYNSYKDLKDATGLSPSLIHYHLNKMLGAGQVEASREARSGSSGGRPAILFFLKVE